MRVGLVFSGQARGLWNALLPMLKPAPALRCRQAGIVIKHGLKRRYCSGRSDDPVRYQLIQKPECSVNLDGFIFCQCP